MSKVNSVVNRSHWFVLLTFATMVSVTGCGEPGPAMPPVSGVVIKNGQPVPNAMVKFFPLSGRPSYATSDAAGRYQLQYGMDQFGASLGLHDVIVTIGGPGPPSGPVEGGPDGRGTVSQPVAQSGPIEVQLPEQVEVIDGENTIDLVLQ